MTRSVANNIMRFCDFMNGYIGQSIQKFIITFPIMFAFIVIVSVMFVKCS